MTQDSILFLGDSLIAEGHWPSLLPEFTTTSYGLPGETSRELLLRLDRHDDALRKHPLAVIMIGTNDLLQEDYSYPQTIGRICDRLSASGPSRASLICSLPPFHLPWVAPGTVARLNELTLSLCAQPRIVHCDLHQPFGRSAASPFQMDGVHFNETGYGLWADCLRKTIAKPSEDHYC